MIENAILNVYLKENKNQNQNQTLELSIVLSIGHKMQFLTKFYIYLRLI